MKQCCHINLPLLYGMNNAQRPFYIDTSFMEDLKPGGHITVSGLESWLHIIMQLCDSLCYLHDKTIIHNKIKNDNVVIGRVCSSFFDQCLLILAKHVY